jgi:hypothetical protein
MPASIGGAGIGTGVALHFSGKRGHVHRHQGRGGLEGLLRIGRLILRTRLGRQGLLRRNLITVFFTVNNPREKFSHPRHPGTPSPPPARPATTIEAARTRVASSTMHALNKKHLK